MMRKRVVLFLECVAAAHCTSAAALYDVEGRTAPLCGGAALNLDRREAPIQQPAPSIGDIPPASSSPNPIVGSTRIPIPVSPSPISPASATSASSTSCDCQSLSSSHLDTSPSATGATEYEPSPPHTSAGQAASHSVQVASATPTMPTTSDTCAGRQCGAPHPEASGVSPSPLQPSGTLEDEDDCEEWEDEDGPMQSPGPTVSGGPSGSGSAANTTDTSGSPASGTGGNCTFGMWQCSGTELQLCGYTTIDAVCEFRAPPPYVKAIDPQLGSTLIRVGSNARSQAQAVSSALSRWIVQCGELDVTFHALGKHMDALLVEFPSQMHLRLWPGENEA